jgi:MFS family permease
MAFIVIALVGMYIGRRLGWLLSRKTLYITRLAVVVVLCIVWGLLIAYLVHLLINWQHPYWILKIIFGFALGGYVAMPNVGLVAESSIPPNARQRHLLISLLPFWIYVLSSVGLAYLL